MLTPGTFVARKSEFKQTSTTAISLALTEAARHIDAATFGSRYDDAVAELAAHLLWTSPLGTTTRLDGGSEPAQKSRYWHEYRRIAQEVAYPPILLL